MSTVDQKRVAAAIKGALLADAASMGTHMMMDPEEIKKAVPSVEAPEFKNAPAPVGYSEADYPGHYGPGMPSPWGEQLVFATEYAGKSQCVTSGHMSVRMKDWVESFGGVQDESLKEFVNCMKETDRSVEVAGAEDDRAHSYARIIPVVCLYAGEGDMLERVKDTIMVYQSNPKAVRFGMAAASLLESVLLGKSLKEGLEQLAEDAMGSKFSAEDAMDIGDACIQALMDARSKDLDAVMESLGGDGQDGRSSRFPSAFVVPIFMFYKAMADGEVNEDAYIKAIRANILAGGDTCCRSIFIGAVLGAAAGSVPESFVEKFSKETMADVDLALKGIIEVL